MEFATRYHDIAGRVGVGSDRRDRAHVLGPARARDPLLDQLQRGVLRLGGLPGGAQAGDAGQQGQRRRAALPGRVLDQSLAHQLLHGGGAAAADPGTPLRPPGAEQLADHELRVQRAAHGQQLAGRPQHLGEQGVGRRDIRAPRARSWARRA